MAAFLTQFKRYLPHFCATLVVVGFVGIVLAGTVYAQQPSNEAREAAGLKTVTEDNTGKGGGKNTISSFLLSVVLGVFGILVGWSGALLDAMLVDYTLKFGEFYESRFGFAIDEIWSIVRDLFNFFFIFGLVYIGFKLIISSDDSNAKRTLITLIAAALLVNFSLFISKVVIDVSHAFTAEIMESFGDYATGFDLKSGQVERAGTAAAFMQILDIQGASDGKGMPANQPASVSKLETFNNSPYTVILLTAVLMLVATFAFAAGAFLLLVRFIALLIFMVFSPMMFLGWVLPSMSSFTSRWWSKFLGYAFFAPAYVFMLYLAVRVMTTLDDASEGLVLSDTYSSASAAYIVIPIYLTTAGFLIASVIVAKQMGVAGAGATIKAGNWARGRAQRTFSYPVRWGARKGVNASAEWAGSKFDRYQRSSTQASSRLGRGLGRLGRAVARNTTVDSAVRSATAAGTTATLGTGSTNAAVRKQEAAIKSRVDRQADIDAGVKADKLGEIKVSDAKVDPKKLTSDQRTEADKVAAKLKAEGKIASSDVGTMTEADRETVLNEVESNRQKAVSKMSNKVANMTAADFEKLSQQEREDLASFMSTSQFDKLMESDELSDTDKNKLYEKRSNAIKGLVTENKQIISKKLSNLTVTQLETLGADFIAENAHLLSSKQMDDLSKSKKFTDAQNTYFKNSRTNKLEALVGTKPDQVFNLSTSTTTTTSGTTTTTTPDFNERKKAKDIAKLPAKVLTSDAAKPYLTADVLDQIANDKDNTISLTDRTTIGQNALDYATDPATSGTPEAAEIRKFFSSPRNIDKFGI